MPEQLLDPPEDIIFDHCGYCGGEIYEGETYYDIDGKSVHADCLSDFASNYFADRVKEAGVHAKAY